MWQVALERTKPHGRVIGIDLIPAQPPRGVITFQGDFLSPMVQKLVKDLLLETRRKEPVQRTTISEDDHSDDEAHIHQSSYIDIERHASQNSPTDGHESSTGPLVDVRMHRVNY